MLPSLLLKLASIHDYVCQRLILTYSPKDPTERWPHHNGGTRMDIRGDVPKAEGWLGEQEGPALQGQGCHSCRALPLCPSGSCCLVWVLGGFCLQQVDTLLCFPKKVCLLYVCSLHHFNHLYFKYKCETWELNTPNGGLGLKIHFSLKYTKDYLNAYFHDAFWLALKIG